MFYFYVFSVRLSQFITHTFSLEVLRLFHALQTELLVRKDMFGNSVTLEFGYVFDGFWTVMSLMKIQKFNNSPKVR